MSTDTSSSHGSLRSGEKSPQSRRRVESIQGLRRLLRQTHPLLRYRDYALIFHVTNVVEPFNYGHDK